MLSSQVPLKAYHLYEAERGIDLWAFSHFDTSRLRMSDEMLKKGDSYFNQA